MQVNGRSCKYGRKIVTTCFDRTASCHVPIVRTRRLNVLHVRHLRPNDAGLARGLTTRFATLRPHVETSRAFHARRRLPGADERVGKSRAGGRLRDASDRSSVSIISVGHRRPREREWKFGSRGVRFVLRANRVPNGGYVSSELLPGKKLESLAGQHPGAAVSAPSSRLVSVYLYAGTTCAFQQRSREHSWRIITYVKFFSLYWPRAGTRKTTD